MKAPKKDRIYGSKKNKPGSASTSKSSSVKFSAKTEEALRNKMQEHNKKASEGRKATLGQLKAVYRRGSGAFSSSHRPGKTRDQWAMARVNAYLKLLKSGRPANSNYTQDNDLLPSGHPRSTKKSASVDGIVASAYLVPEEQDLAEALLEVVAKHGKFNEDQIGVWAGYTPPEENEVASIGVNCANCVFYRGGSECAIIALPVEPMGKCRFAVIPEGVVNDDAVVLYNRDELKNDIDNIYYESELAVDLENEQSSPEESLFALAELSGEGYELITPLRAAWMRAVRDQEENPLARAQELAINMYESRDADLLPRKVADSE